MTPQLTPPSGPRIRPYSRASERKLVGRNLRQIRIDRDLTQRELAAALGYSNQCSISHIETGRKFLQGEQLETAARFLGVSSDAITAGLGMTA
jgi:transcriptional regulator with XRE-family HTH domain